MTSKSNTSPSDINNTKNSKTDGAVGNNWERRWHALLEQWVVIAANSAVRPWSGIVSDNKVETRPAFDKDCYLSLIHI